MPGSSLELALKLSLRGRPTLGELTDAVPIVGLAADDRAKPLLEVPRKVQQQVADTVHVLPRSPPDLILVQLIQAVLYQPDAGVELLASLGDDTLPQRGSLAHIVHLFPSVPVVPAFRPTPQYPPVKSPS